MRIIRLNGKCLTFKGRVYSSVGIQYRIEYDETAFHMGYSRIYSCPEDKADGADDSTGIYTLTPLKRGIFKIYEVEGFQGEEIARHKHTIVVI